jgi:hypothetical protein
MSSSLPVPSIGTYFECDDDFDFGDENSDLNPLIRCPVRY